MSPVFYRYYIPLATLTFAAAAHAESEYTLSLGGGIAPRYQGSNQYRGVIGPSISAAFSNGFFISTSNGAGYRYTSPRGLFVSGAIGYARGRKDSGSFSGDGSDYLKGMGDVPGSVMAHWQAGVRDDDGVEVSVTIDTPITHASRGFAGHVDLSVPLLHAGKNAIVLTGTANAGTGRYTQTFYGVTNAQAASSGFRPYSLTGGFHSAAMSLAWTHSVSQHWSVLATAGISRILGRFGDSPIVQTRSNYYGAAGVSFRF
ncbi:MltA-interacting MipA family protein [Burkholderia ambifaria MEX-5]|uniref:MltA-interacting MipA family protein n=1 Tax=Burkholderia ambifaria MEX-5 TaxID=396597 RepID=B1T8F4_9BURK|nr:MipA/OmpV family protein [Burkholderia ambifaria]EDT40157.1 MltA-interacting MipA family protein [Burkholderia ambifaria MEX-5]